MKLKTLLIGCFGGFIMLNSCTESPSVKDYSAYVNPFIGTGGHGHTFPGAVVPHGMIQPSPDTRIDGWDACSGYYYDDNTINGFSHTHVSGTGCCDYGDVLLMPIVGKPQYLTTDPESQKLAYASAFSHENETAEPGYYSVFLDTYQVKAEITATKRGAIHRYTFPESTESGFIIDLDYSLQRQTNYEMEIEVISDTEICGHKKTTYWAFDQYINFYAKFSKPFAYTLITDSVTMDNGKRLPVCKAVLHFNTKKDEEVLVKVGVSAVDIAGARKNVESEIPEWDFDKVRKDARIAWNNYLSKIDITTSDKEDKTIFYTALYHTAISPNLFTDADGRYLGMDLEVHQGDTINPLYTVFSLWDTFRALHPLMTIIDPDLNNQFINSLIKKHQEGGIYPMWDLGSNYTGTMIGYHAVPVIVDAYLKGIGNFDPEKALEACVATANLDNYRGIGAYKELGYVPFNEKDSYNAENWSLSKTLEYAYDDYCIARMAEKLGKKEIADEFYKRSQNYRNVYNPATSFMQPRDDKGEFQKDFKADAYTPHICESNGWQYFWSVQHDIDGLIGLTGGKERFAQKLDSMFTFHPSADDELPLFSTGMIGQYAHGNEPSHHVIYLYNAVDQPWKTQEYVAKVMNELYLNSPAGLCGNEDCGQMSAWYVFSAMGFYPVNPISGQYEIGTPLFPEVQLHLDNGKTFTVKAPAVSKENIYIRSTKLNGKPYDKSYITHEQIMSGATLEFEMGKEKVTSDQ